MTISVKNAENSETSAVIIEMTVRVSNFLQAHNDDGDET